jgi:hypothetical protein
MLPLWFAWVASLADNCLAHQTLSLLTPSLSLLCLPMGDPAKNIASSSHRSRGKGSLSYLAGSPPIQEPLLRPSFRLRLLQLRF